MAMFSPRCPNCGSNNTKGRGFMKSFVATMLPFGFIHNKECMTCGNTFRKTII